MRGEETGQSAILLWGTGRTSPNLRWAAQFDAADPFILVDDGRERVLWVSELELERAKAASAAEVRSTAEIGVSELRDPAGRHHSGTARLLAAICRRHRLHTLVVEGGFPLGLGRELEEMGFEVRAEPSLYRPERRQKSQSEIAAIDGAMRASAVAIQKAIDVIAASTVRNGILCRRGKPLSGDDLRQIIETSLYESGYLTESTICCGAPENASPHMTSSAVLRAGLPIVLDVYPYDRRLGYWGDTTRTVVKGKPHPEVQKMYAAVLAAQAAGLAAVRPGITGKEIDAAVCRVLAQHGYGSITPPYDKIRSAARMIHSTGHGVGLEIHEEPRISFNGAAPLEVGDVITIEPGLYHPQFGGIRIEDTVVVTQHGCRNLAPLGKQLQAEGRHLGD